MDKNIGKTKEEIKKDKIIPKSADKSIIILLNNIQFRIKKY